MTDKLEDADLSAYPHIIIAKVDWEEGPYARGYSDELDVEEVILMLKSALADFRASQINRDAFNFAKNRLRI